MKTKLTLTLSKSAIEAAKSYAKITGRSLSEIIENYLISLTQEHSMKPLSTKLSKIVGVITLPQDYDEEYERKTNLEKKHL